ncbi:LmbU family transcriptional regulator [Actinomadura madurae]|uniref:LmbU family transcriptional regulator n=1 Tax=Actinomadura madurae TaxID=1993 RepID=UPI002025C112|nr:LmbU family transcriptional regulator [Actinomadura madurae]URN07324.1 LmbU family transcriptional regulator [Actinomadura madurae]
MTKRTSLLLPEELSIESWVSIGQEISVIADASSWWLGDWLVYGQEMYPGRYRRAMKGTGLSYQTLRNYAWIARRFPMSRRRDTLSMQHHAEVVALPDAEQDEWLDRAALDGWSVTELRRRLRAARQNKPAGAAADPTFILRVNVDAERQRRWEEAAEQTGADLTRWVCDALDRAAVNVLENDGK